MISDAAWPQTVRGSRATIHRFGGEPIEADWLDEAAQAIAGRSAPCPIHHRLDAGDQAWWIGGDDEIVGALCGRIVELRGRPGDLALVWTWLAVDARWRAFGYGGAAVPLFEQAAQQAGAQIALAPLPPDNGVALYFWLRLGYTPIRSAPVDPSDRPTGVPSDALWMQRSLDSGSAIDSLARKE